MKDLKEFIIKNELLKICSEIDLSVYRINGGLFRLPFSEKNDKKTLFVFNLIISSSEITFKDSIITYHSDKFSFFNHDNDKLIEKEKDVSEITKLVQNITLKLRPDAKSFQKHINSDGKYVISFKSLCPAGRTHKSNHQKLIVNNTAISFVCFDADCSNIKISKDTILFLEFFEYKLLFSDKFFFDEKEFLKLFLIECDKEFKYAVKIQNQLFAKGEFPLFAYNKKIKHTLHIFDINKYILKYIDENNNENSIENDFYADKKIYIYILNLFENENATGIDQNIYKSDLLTFIEHLKPKSLFRMYTKIEGDNFCVLYNNEYYFFNNLTNHYILDNNLNITTIKIIETSESILLQYENDENKNKLNKCYAKFLDAHFHNELKIILKGYILEKETSNDFDNVIAFNNTFYNFNTKKMNIYEKNTFIFQYIKHNFIYIENILFTAEFLLWKNYFYTLFEQNVSYQFFKILNFCIDNNNENSNVFFLLGDGYNGKTVLVELIISLFENIYAGTTSSATFSHISDPSKPNSSLYSILKKRIAFLDEPSQNLIEESIFKKLASAGTISVRENYKNEESIPLITKFFILSNAFPIPFSGITYAFKRRCNIIMVKNIFNKENWLYSK